MTIGPDPIRQIDSRSRRLGKCAHLLDPTVDQAPGVVRPGPCFRVELDGAGAQLGILETLDRLVIEGDVGRLARLAGRDRKSTRLNSSHVAISYAVFCLKK